MSFPWILFGFLPLILGYPAVARLARGEQGTAAPLAWKAAIALGLGLGLQSVLMFFWLKFYGSWSPLFNWVLGGAAAAALLTWVLERRAAGPRPLEAEAQEPISRILFPYFVIVLLLAVAFSVLYTEVYRHGAWDAWSHWNLRARFIIRGGPLWTNAYHPDFWNPLNYPLLIPLNVAAGWGLAGTETYWIPGGIALSFVLASAFLLQSSLAWFRSPNQGYLAAIFLLGTPYFLIHGNSQYSDIPVAFYFLATFVAAAAYDLDEKKPVSFLFLSGILAGLAAWTKNEGLLFIGCFFSVRLVTRFFRVGAKAAVREMLWMALGLFPFLALDFYVKTTLYPPRSIFETRGVLYSFAKFTDPARYWKITAGIFRSLFEFGLWFLPFPAVLLPYLIWMKPQASGPARKTGGAILGTLLLMLGGYFGVYLSTPHDLTWHMNTSIDRLLLCMWPSFLFAFFMIVRTPDEALAAQPAPAEKKIGDWEETPCT